MVGLGWCLSQVSNGAQQPPRRCTSLDKKRRALRWRGGGAGCRIDNHKSLDFWDEKRERLAFSWMIAFCKPTPTPSMRGGKRRSLAFRIA